MILVSRTLEGKLHAANVISPSSKSVKRRTEKGHESQEKEWEIRFGNKREGGIRNKDKNPNQISRLNNQCSGGLRFKSRCEESLPCFSWFSWGFLSWCRNIMLPHPFPFRSFPISYSLMIPSFRAILKSSNIKQINKRQHVTMALHGMLDTVRQNIGKYESQSLSLWSYDPSSDKAAVIAKNQARLGITCCTEPGQTEAMCIMYIVQMYMTYVL